MPIATTIESPAATILKIDWLHLDLPVLVKDHHGALYIINSIDSDLYFTGIYLGEFDPCEGYIDDFKMDLVPKGTKVIFEQA